MKVVATVTKGEFVAGREYDLPTDKAMAAIIAGTALPLVTESNVNTREKAVKQSNHTEWRTR